MKRDMDLIRELLFAVEALPPDGSVLDESYQSPTVGITPAVLQEHARLLVEKDLVDGDAAGSMNDGIPEFRLERLTWSGHEFLDAVRSDSIWSRVKKTATDQGLSLTLSVTKALAIQYTKESLKQIGISTEP